jgi:hypothetical protein
MAKYRVSWEEGGVQQNRIFGDAQKQKANNLYASLKAVSKDKNNLTKITDIEVKEINDCQCYRNTYHTPVRRHIKIRRGEKARINR